MTPIVNAMSVDVEDYFHASAFDHVVSRESWGAREGRVVANTRRLLACLAGAGVTATFFVLGWVAARHPALVREIAGEGHEMASHGYHHELIYTLTPDRFRTDVRRAKQVIEDAAGCRVAGYRAPSFSMLASTPWALDVLLDEGHTYDASIFPIHHDRYGIPDAARHPSRLDRAAGALIEFPGSTVRVGGVNLPVAGGGYFRLLPYAWTRWGINRVNTTERQPAVFYIHPWEIDAAQPRLPVSRVAAWRHYTGLAATEQRLSRLLKDFRFDSLAAVLSASPAWAVPPLERRAHASN